MFTVYFRNTTITPSQPGLRTLVDAAIADCGARWTGEEAELMLPDGSLFYLFGEDEGEGMLLEYPVLTDKVANAVYAVADRTSTFIIENVFAPVAMRTARNIGEIRPADMSMSGYDVIDDVEALQGRLAEFTANNEVADQVRAPRSSPKPSSPFQDRTLTQKLADLIFGKSV